MSPQPPGFSAFFGTHLNATSYYLTAAWVRECKDPLGILEEYRSYLSGEDAEWCIRQELKKYKRIALIHIGETISESTRVGALEKARYFGMSYEEIRGSDRLLKKLFSLERTDEFVIVAPG
jgi:hypothetical protein